MSEHNTPSRSNGARTALVGRLRRRAGMVPVYAVLVVICVPLVFPFLWMAGAALKPPDEIFAYPPRLLPENPAWGNLAEVFTFQPFARQIWNSVYIAVLVALITCTVSLLSGYAFARLRFPGSTVIFLVFLSALMLPSEVTIVPNYAIMGALGLVDTHVPLIVLPAFGATGVMGVFLMRQFFLGMPKEIEEAALLDGLGRWGILWHIALPLARPMLATVGIIAFLASWNLFLEPVVFLNSQDLFTVPIALTNYTDATGHPIWNLQLAATAVSTLPVLLAYMVARRQITDSLSQTGLK